MKILQLLLLALCCSTSSLLLDAQAELLTHKPPVYPLAAKAAGISGSVVLKGTVTKEGKMDRVYAVSGPPELRQAAVDAVQTWTYKPYHHFGHLVTVDTTITLNFVMGKGSAEIAEAQAKAKAELVQASQAAQPLDSTPKQ